MLLLDGALPNTVRFERGKHSIPFSISIPSHCPTTVHSDNVSIIYKVKSKLDVCLRDDKTVEHEVLVVSLSSTPRQRDARPVEQVLIIFSFSFSFCFVVIFSFRH